MCRYFGCILIDYRFPWKVLKLLTIADTGGADLAGHQNMINALKRLGQVEPEALPEQMAAFGINYKSGIMALLSSHPPIEARIEALEKRAITRT